MALTSRPGKRADYPATAAAPPPSASQARPHTASSASSSGSPTRSARRLDRHLFKVPVHNLWVVVLLVVMVGKVGEWVPVISGLPVLKIAFVVAVLYVSRVSVLYAPVRVTSLPIAQLALAFFSLSIISFVWSIYKTATLLSWYTSAVYLVSFVLLVKTTQTQKDVERLLIGLAVAGSALTIALLSDYHGGRAHINGNFDPNDLAYSLDTLLPLVLVLRGRRWGLRRVVVSGLAVSMGLAVLLTASRGGVLGLVVVVLAVSAFPLDLSGDGQLKRRNIASLVVVLGLTAALGAALFGFLPESSKEHLETLVHPNEDYNTSTTLNASRRVLWTRSLKLAFERPIGYGTATAPAVDGIYGHGQYRTVHNSVIQAFLELGVLGLWLYLASYYLAIRDLGRISAVRARDGPDSEGAKAALYARALRVALLGNFAAGFFLSQAYSASLWMILAICCAFIRMAAPGDATAARRPFAVGSRWRRPRPAA